MFQGIGVIEGKVSLSENRLYIEIEGKQYQLLKTKKVIAKFLATQEKSKLVVYPKVIHFPQRDKYQIVSFTYVAHEQNGGEGYGLFDQLEPGQFILSGVWQFIPVCRVPCISIYRNFQKEEKGFEEKFEAFKGLEPEGKAKFSKAIHVPLMWRDSLVSPFRFNPRLQKEEQQPKYFLSVLANFQASKDVWIFESLRMPPTVDLPNFFNYKLKKSKPPRTEHKTTNSTPSSKPKKKVIRIGVAKKG